MTSYVSQLDKFSHSNLYFATSKEVERYNALCIKAGLFDEGELCVGTSDQPVNAVLNADGRIKALPTADDAAQAEATENESLAQAAE